MYISTISESKYQTFKQCRLKYRYRYVDRLPEPEGSNVEALHFGPYIHKILEDGAASTNRDELIKIAEETKGTYKITKKYTGKDLVINETIYNAFTWIVIGCFGIAGAEKFAKK